MSDLLINKIILEQQKQGNQNKPNFGVSNNSVLDKIQSSDTNRELFSDFLIQKKNKAADNNLKNKNNTKKLLTIAGGITIFIGGLSVIFGKKKLVDLRNTLNQSIEFMQDLKNSKHFEILNNVKLAVVKCFNNILGYLYTLDKVKDFCLLKSFEALGKFGKMITNASKLSLLITEKFSLSRLYKTLRTNIDSAGKFVKNALLAPENFSNEQEQKLAERLNILLNGNKENKGLTAFADDLISGMKERTGNLKDIIQKENINPYRQKYFPTEFKWSEFKRTANNWKESLFSLSGNKDILRENWAETEKTLIENIKETGANSGNVRNFGAAMQQMEAITKEMNELSLKSDCSSRFKELAEQIKSLNQIINTNTENIINLNPIAFETSGEKYAGRVLDLSAGGGMSEMLIPPVVGGIIAYNTLKDSKPEERKEKFVKNGGPELIGGLAGWMITSNLLAVSGAAGMLAGLATAGVMHVLSENYLKHIEKAKKTSTT